MENKTWSAYQESLPGQTAKVLTMPFRSGYAFVMHKITGGRYRPELETFFSPNKASSEFEVPLARLPDFLDVVDNLLARHENPIGRNFDGWVDTKRRIEQIPGIKMTDYVLFNQNYGQHILVAERGNSLIPIFVPRPGEIGQNILFGIGREYPKQKFKLEEVAMELSISDIEKNEELGSGYKLRKLSAITNDFELRRHAVLERDGEMIESLRDQGVMTIGEIQSVTRMLVFGGITFEEGSVNVDPSLGQVWISARMISLKEGSERQKFHKSAQELSVFANQLIYFRGVSQFLEENPGIQREFMKSNQYLKHRKAFIDSHIAARGQTEEQIATAMLANYYLAKFEGGSVGESPSQKYTKNKEEFMADIGEFASKLSAKVPKSLSELWEELGDPSLINIEIDQSEKVSVLKNAGEALEKIAQEIWRHKESRNIFNKLVEKSPFDFVDDDEKSSKVVRAIIVNLGLAKVPGEGRFTMGSYLSKVPYYPEGSEVMPFDAEDASYANIEDSIRYIFNGQTFEDPGAESSYESQVARIFTEGTTILNFLAEDPRVPENVRDFIGTVKSENLADRILERYGPISDQDPQVVNRFFKEGFNRFQTMTMHRYVTDFVRGVETNLVLLTDRSWFEKMHRKFGADWKNYDFSEVPPEVLEKAIDATLKTGSHRIDIMNHATDSRLTLKDKQEFLEKVFGWDTYDMQFLRWEKFWNVWNTLGGAWDCICFMRKPVFNAETIKQF